MVITTAIAAAGADFVVGKATDVLFDMVKDKVIGRWSEHRVRGRCPCGAFVAADADASCIRRARLARAAIWSVCNERGQPLLELLIAHRRASRIRWETSEASVVF